MGHPALTQRNGAHVSENPGDTWTAAIAEGDFQRAWRVSDRVLADRDAALRDDPTRPYHERWVWDGRRFDGRQVLVRCYHGLGDTLQFCRYLVPLRRRTASVTLEVQSELADFLADLPGPDRLVPFRPEAPLPPAEADLEIMELGHALRIAPEPVPYLPCPTQPNLHRPKLRVGVCWNVSSAWRPQRSVPLRDLAPLGAVPGLELISLQRGPGVAEAHQPGAPKLLNPDGPGADIGGTAGLIASLDLVVTIDTMVAHLAGGMGRPVWLLLDAAPDWRWLAGGSGSPWYRGVRKFQQGAPGCWGPPVHRLAACLEQFARENRPAAPRQETCLT